MTDTEIIERYFVARGWYHRTYDDHAPRIYLWYLPDGKNFGVELPPILTDFQAFKEHVLEVMDGDGFYVTIALSTSGGLYLIWANSFLKGKVAFSEVIKNNNILHAAVISATGYFEGKK